VRTRRCSPEILRGRLAKAEQFWEVAGLVQVLADGQEPGEIGDAYVTLCVHAGIAAADALCCAGLGEHAQGESHTAATAEEFKRAGRSAEALLMRARRGVPG
jgi:hypothetical protein